jgi:hypothetical protein
MRRVGELGQRVEERTSAGVGLAPGLQRVERCSDGLAGVVTGVDGGTDDRSPALVAFCEVGRDEVVLRAELVVQSPLGHAGVLGDEVHADRRDAAVVEQLLGGRQHAAAGGRHGLSVLHAHPFTDRCTLGRVHRSVYS